nr:outer membrane beta-barrel protein [uncultured Carboxylicivirga sp.]
MNIYLYTIGKIVFLINLTAFCCSMYGQNAAVTIMVTDETGIPIPYATVVIKKLEDDAFVSGAITNEAGAFKLDTHELKNSSITISHIGFYAFHQEVLDACSFDLRTVELKKDITQIGDVTVLGQKTGIHNGINKVIYIPERRVINQSSTGYDVLSRVPNVHIEARNNQIKVGNSSHVLVLIDGVSSNQSLYSINPRDIERIELIKNPNASYASDVTSVINIILKNKFVDNLYVHLNGELSCLNPVNNSGSQMVYTSNKVKVFGGYQWNYFSYSNTKAHVYREDYDEDYIQKYNSVSDDGDQSTNKQIINGGIEIQASNNFNIHFSGSFSPSEYSNNKTSQVLIDNQNTLGYNVIDQLNLEASEQNYVLDLHHKLGKEQQYWELQNSLRFIDRERIGKLNTEESESSQVQREELTSSNWKTYASKFIFNQPIYDFAIVKTGVHYQYSKMNDEFLSNNDHSNLDYTEGRLRLFENLVLDFDKLSAQLSCGLERRNVDVDLQNTSQWYGLPTGFVKYQLNDRHSFSMLYNRRLSYPMYYMLVPFNYFSGDSLSVSVGNPELKPVQNNVFKISHDLELDDWDLNITTSLFYTYSKDKHDIQFANINGVLQSKWVNVGHTKSVGAGIDAYIYLFDCIDLGVECSGYYVSFPNHAYNGYVGDMYTYVDIELPLKMSLGVEAYLSTKEYDINGYYNQSSYIDNITFSKMLFKHHGKLSLVALNPFSSYKETEQHWDASFMEKAITTTDNSAICLRFSYAFNKNTMRNTYKKPLLDDQILNK